MIIYHVLEMLGVYEKAPFLALLFLRQREAAVVTGEGDTFAISTGFERKEVRGPKNMAS